MTTPKFKVVPLEECRPPHRVTRPEQVDSLALSLLHFGWIGSALVGYSQGDDVQLLSGAHRWAAAHIAGYTVLPVMVWEFQDILEAWGTDNWQTIMSSGAR